MTTQAKYNHIPALRFPEFLNNGEWEVKRLGEIAERITVKVGKADLRPVSISAGIGFVDQKNKFGRDISGNQYSDYIVLKKGEFAYNKGNSIKYPQGCVYKLKEFDIVACPNVFVCFRIIDENVCPDFLSAYFANNYHGAQLQQFITSGVRSNGLLNISAEDFFSIQIPLPSLAEQRRIAESLSELDEMIVSTHEKLEQLKTYKKGLMQQLFVTLTGGGKSLIINYIRIPKLRFTAFYNEKEWEEKRMGDLCDLINGMAFKPSDWVATGLPIVRIQNLNNENASFNYCSSEIVDDRCVIDNGALLFSWSGTPGTSFGAYIWNRGKAVLNQHIFIVKPFNVDKLFLKMIIDANISSIIEKSHGGAGLRHITKTDFEGIQVNVPRNLLEQRKIASCLSLMDETINAYAEKVACLGQYKNGLMQQMFPQYQTN